MKKVLLALLVTLGLQIQAQNNCKQLGLGYITTQNVNCPLMLHASVMSWVFTQSDSIYYNWTICVRDTCHSSENMAHALLYYQISLTDTVSVCYSAHTISNSFWQHCSNCDSLIFNGIEWVVFNTPITTSIYQENTIGNNNNKIYDLLGREIIGDIPSNTMYIKNGKKHIKIN